MKILNFTDKSDILEAVQKIHDIRKNVLNLKMQLNQIKKHR